MISDVKLQLILTLYKNDKLTFEEVKILLQEEKPFTGLFQPDSSFDPVRRWLKS